MVTPYEIDMRFANIINKGDGKDSGKDLYAANADGNYIALWEPLLGKVSIYRKPMVLFGTQPNQVVRLLRSS